MINKTKTGKKKIILKKRNWHVKGDRISFQRECDIHTKAKTEEKKKTKNHEKILSNICI